MCPRVAGRSGQAIRIISVKGVVNVSTRVRAGVRARAKAGIVNDLETIFYLW